MNGDTLNPSPVAALAAQAQDGQRVYIPASSLGGNSNTDFRHHATDPRVQAAAAAYFESPDRLHGQTLPAQVILKEQPIHRAMIYAKAAGASDTDIAFQFGYSVSQVRLVLRQPWAQDRLVQILKETGQDAVRHFLTTETLPSLQVLKAIRDDGSNSAQARIAATNSILDRVLPKTTHVTSDNTNRNIPADMARIDKELNDLRRQMGEIPGGN